MLNTSNKILLLVTLLVLSAPVLAQEQEGITTLNGTVRRATRVRSKPSAREQVISRLPKDGSVRILRRETRKGFWRVILDGGRQGYVSARDLAIEPSEETAPLSEAAAGPCVQTLADCKENGCAAPDSKRGIFNKAKNHQPTGSASVLLSFPDLRALQRQADAVVDQGKELTQAQRDSLKNFTVANGRAGEGKLVKLTGFIATGADPHPNTGESVNCSLRNQTNNDFHIPIALRPANSEFQGVVVEMIPHDRPAEWNLVKLKKVKRQALKVMVVGGLFYDNDHVVNSDPTDDLRGQPKRFSLWEIHPITQFFVCARAGNTCDPSSVRQWTKLEDFQ
jgi:uncharacterized protein YgiM (DUF1202 family)